MRDIIIGRIVTGLVYLLIGFFAQKYQVAKQLLAGETTHLYGMSFSIKDIINFIILSIVPALLPLGFAIYGRIRERYKLIIARLSPETMTNAEVKDRAAEATPTEIIKTVASKPT